MPIKVTRQLQKGKDPLELTEVEWSALTDELADEYQKLCYLKTGLEASLGKLTGIYRDLKRSGQNIQAIELHEEMRFIGRLIATIDIMLLDENVVFSLEETFDT